MPKVIDQKTIEMIIRLREENKESFVAIGKRLGLHENTIAAIYKRNKFTQVAVVPEVVDNPHSITNLDKNLAEIEQTMDLHIVAIVKLMKNPIFSKRIHQKLNTNSLFIDSDLGEAYEQGIQEFKEEYQLHNLTEDQLQNLAKILYEREFLKEQVSELKEQNQKYAYQNSALKEMLSMMKTRNDCLIALSHLRTR